MFRGALFLSLMAALSGCADFATKMGPGPYGGDFVSDDTQPQDKAGDALAVLNENDPAYPQLLTKRQELLSQAKEFERDTVIQAGDQAKKGDWAAAVSTYEKALKQYPSSKILRLGLSKTYEGRAKRATDLEVELLVARGNWLALSLPLYHQLITLDPKTVATQLKRDIWSGEAKHVAKDLTDRGVKALKEGDLKTAELTLPLAYQLVPSPDVEQAVERLKARQTETQRQQDIARQRQQEQEKQEQARQQQQQIGKLRASYDEAIKKNDLKESREMLTRLEAITGATSETKQLRQALTQSISAEVQRYLDEGSAHYSKSEFEKALLSWRKALALDPANEQAAAHIDRAERILSKLNTLRRKKDGTD